MRRVWHGYFEPLFWGALLVVMSLIPETVILNVASVLALLFLAWRVYIWLGRKAKGAAGRHQSPEES